jgi:hypothetical protein
VEVGVLALLHAPARLLVFPGKRGVQRLIDLAFDADDHIAQRSRAVGEDVVVAHAVLIAVEADQRLGDGSVECQATPRC